MRDAVAGAADEGALIEWLRARIAVESAPALNAKLETFVVERMKPKINGSFQPPSRHGESAGIIKNSPYSRG